MAEKDAALLERALKHRDAEAANELLATAVLQLGKLEKGISTIQHLLICLQNVYSLDIKKTDRENSNDDRQ